MVPVASTPSISTRPPVGSSRPAMMLKIVLLPQPDGPIRLTKRPCGIDSVTGASAWKTPVGVLNAMLTWSTTSFEAGDLQAGCAPGACALHRPCRGTEFPAPRVNYITKNVPATMRLGCSGTAGFGSAGELVITDCPRCSIFRRHAARAADHFAPVSAALRIGDQRAISAFTKPPNFAGERSSLPGIEPPSSARRFCTSGSSSALSSAAASLSIDLLRRALRARKCRPRCSSGSRAPAPSRSARPAAPRAARSEDTAIGLDRAAVDLRGDAHRLLAEEIDMAADRSFIAGPVPR